MCPTNMALVEGHIERHSAALWRVLLVKLVYIPFELARCFITLYPTYINVVPIGFAMSAPTNNAAVPASTTSVRQPSASRKYHNTSPIALLTPLPTGSICGI